MPLRIGETFAGYRVLRLLGSGGMGEVYLVQHPRLPRQEAMKVLRTGISSDPSFRERFIREADLAAGLRHPHIVGVHDRGEHEGQLWIAMDYVDGTDLAQSMAQRYPAGMPIDLVAPIISAVASALDYAHKKGLLHRDVKPANIIVADLDTDDPSVFLADFGIARPLDDTNGITTTNMTVGTVAYAAPEQLMGEAMDGRADEYALAATSYHLLTGTQLFPHSNPAVVISRHLNTSPPKLGDSRADLGDLDVAFQSALAKDPDDRHPSCSAFAQNLRGESRRQTAVSPSALTLAAPRRKQQAPHSSSGTTGEHPPQKIMVTGSRHWVVGITAAAAVLLIGIGAISARALQSSDPVATEITDAVPQSTVTSAPAKSNPARSSNSADYKPTMLPSSVSPTASEEAGATLAPNSTSSTAVVDVAPEEQRFLTAVRQLPMYVRLDRYGGDVGLIAQGYKACEAFDQYPNDSQRATRVIYPSGNTVDGGITMDGDMFMLYSANYLCPRHAHLYDNY